MVVARLMVTNSGCIDAISEATEAKVDATEAEADATEAEADATEAAAVDALRFRHIGLEVIIRRLVRSIGA